MSNMLQNASGVVGSAGKQLQSTTRRVGNTIQVTTSRMLPPQQRKEIAQNLRIFAERNPKLAAFLVTQAVLAGLPLVLFFAFATTTLLVSLTTCLLLGLLAALAFTFLVVGFVLIFVVPTVFVASCSATLIFVWGLVGYVVLRRLNGGEAPSKRGTRMGDKLRELKEGRTGFHIGDAAGHGQDSEEVNLMSAKKIGDNKAKERNDTSPQENNGVFNGINGHHDSLQWEQKWDSGVQLQPVVLDVDNPYEVLKVETEAS
ncbi:hypothetical protein J1614_005144 [Plenodomus biglobosus]|nr:hypothetical protein J1614_005144 [Plenodomus biglobosus]